MANSANVKIAKNTVILYIRMMVVLIITLYTSRLVLKALGVDDFGLYSVIGGVVSLFAFFKSSMGKATQRFLNVEMVAEDGGLKAVFQTSWTIHVIISFIVLILAETLGLWFLNTSINIPEGRFFAANILYHTTVVALCASILEIPFNADIIAHEKMTFFAIVSVIDAVLKLIIALYILFDNGDRLILYGVLIMFVSLLNIVLYYVYCKKKYSEICIKLCYDRNRFRSILGFVGWTLLGQTAIVGCNQGNVILINMFHTVAANAAMSIGNQVSSAVNNLAANFQTAFNPQITKSYAENDYDYLRYLVFVTSKISYCLLFVVALPISVNINWVLSIWLEDVPELSDIFCILCLVNGILNALSAPLNFTVLSTGHIKWFQISTAVVYLIDLVLLYALFQLGLPPETAMWVKVGIMVLVLLVRLFYAHKEIPCIGIVSYSSKVLLPLALMSVGSVSIAIVSMPYSPTIIYRLLYTSLVTILTIGLIWFVAMSKSERNTMLNLIIRKR